MTVFSLGREPGNSAPVLPAISEDSMKKELIGEQKHIESP